MKYIFSKNPEGRIGKKQINIKRVLQTHNLQTHKVWSYNVRFGAPLSNSHYQFQTQVVEFT